MRRTQVKSASDMKRLLDRCAVDFSEENNGDLYIQSYKFNFWAGISEQINVINIHTNWPVRSCVDDDALNKFVNTCNAQLPFCQFFLSPRRDKFLGSYQLVCKEGVDSKLLLRSMSAFANSFFDAIHVLDEDDLIGVDPEIEMACLQQDGAFLQ